MNQLPDFYWNQVIEISEISVYWNFRQIKKKNKKKYECAYMIFGLLLHYALGHYTFAVWSVSSICLTEQEVKPVHLQPIVTSKHHHDLVQVDVCSKKSEKCFLEFYRLFWMFSVKH